MGWTDALQENLSSAWTSVTGGGSSDTPQARVQTGLDGVAPQLESATTPQTSSEAKPGEQTSDGYQPAQSFPTSGAWTAYTPADQVSVDPSKDSDGARAAVENGLARVSSLINSHQYAEAKAAYQEAFAQYRAYRASHPEDKARNQKWLTQTTALRVRLLAAEGKLKKSGFDKEAEVYLRDQEGPEAEQARRELHEFSPRTQVMGQALESLDELDRLNGTILDQRLAGRSFIKIAARVETHGMHDGMAELIQTIRDVIREGHATTIDGAIAYIRKRHEIANEGQLVKGTDPGVEELKRIEALPTLPLNAVFLSKTKKGAETDPVDLADRLADSAGDYREAHRILHSVLKARIAEAGGDFKKLLQWQKEGKLSPQESRAVKLYDEAFNPTKSVMQLSRIEQDGLFDFATRDLPLMIPVFRAGAVVQGVVRGALGAGRLATGAALVARGGAETILLRGAEGQETSAGEALHAGTKQTVLHTVIQGVGSLPLPSFIKPFVSFGSLTGISAGEAIYADAEGDKSVLQHVRDAAAHTAVTGMVAEATKPEGQPVATKRETPVEHSETILPPPPVTSGVGTKRGVGYSVTPVAEGVSISSGATSTRFVSATPIAGTDRFAVKFQGEGGKTISLEMTAQDMSNAGVAEVGQRFDLAKLAPSSPSQRAHAGVPEGFYGSAPFSADEVPQILFSSPDAMGSGPGVVRAADGSWGVSGRPVRPLIIEPLGAPVQRPEIPDYFQTRPEGSPMDEAFAFGRDTVRPPVPEWAARETLPPESGYPNVVRHERGAPRPTPETRAQLAGGQFMSPGMVTMYAQKFASGTLTITPAADRPGYFRLSGERTPTVVVNEAAVQVIRSRALVPSARPTVRVPALVPPSMAIGPSKRPTVVAPAPEPMDKAAYDLRPAGERDTMPPMDGYDPMSLMGLKPTARPRPATILPPPMSSVPPVSSTQRPAVLSASPMAKSVGPESAMAGTMAAPVPLISMAPASSAAPAVQSPVYAKADAATPGALKVTYVGISPWGAYNQKTGQRDRALMIYDVTDPVTGRTEQETMTYQDASRNGFKVMGAEKDPVFYVTRVPQAPSDPGTLPPSGYPTDPAPVLDPQPAAPAMPTLRSPRFPTLPAAGQK